MKFAVSTSLKKSKQYLRKVISVQIIRRKVIPRNDDLFKIISDYSIIKPHKAITEGKVKISFNFVTSI